MYIWVCLIKFKETTSDHIHKCTNDSNDTCVSLCTIFHRMMLQSTFILHPSYRTKYPSHCLDPVDLPNFNDPKKALALDTLVILPAYFNV